MGRENTARNFQDRMFECQAAFAGLPESPGDNDRAACAGASANVDDMRDDRSLGTDYDEINSLGNAFYRGIAVLAEYGLVPRIDKEKLSLVLRIEHISYKRQAN